MNSMNEEPSQGMTILSFEDLSDMLTAEFVVKGVIPGNYTLEVIDLELGNRELQLTFNIGKEYVN